MSSTQLARFFVLIVLIGVLVQMAFAGQLSVSPQQNSILNSTPKTSGNSTPFDYVVVIVMENQGICDILPSLVCNTINIGLAPYMTSLAASYALAANYTAITHPSLPNYLSLFSGRDWGCQGYDGGPNSNPCTITAWNSTTSNLVDRLEASGLSWKAYMENMTSNCGINDSGYYAVRHDPFVYFKDIYNNPARCNNVVPALANDTALLNDLASTATASNLMWLTPNLCNDMHDDCTSSQSSHPTCGSGGNITDCIHQGDTFLSRLVPGILKSTIFQTQNALLYVTFDEGNGYCPTGNPNRDCIPTILAGSVIEKPHISTISYSHFSFLATLEAAWGLSPLTANDTTARPMSEFFTTLFPPRIFPSPISPEAGQQVQLNAIASGGTGPYTFSWNFGDDTVGTGNPASHVYTSPGAYTIKVNATDSLGAKATSTQTITVANGPTVHFTTSLSSPQIGQSIAFTANASAGTPPYVFKWDFGDHNSGTGSQLAHTYSSTGSFIVKANVTDAVGVIASQSQTLTIGKRSSSTNLVCLPSTTTINRTITCTSTVTDTSSGVTGTPTGTMSFASSVHTSTFNATNCTLMRGSCSVDYTQTATNTTSTITASYNGDPTYQSSSQTTRVAVELRNTTTSLACAPAADDIGQTSTCTANVVDSSPGTATTPTGSITFAIQTSGATVLASAVSCTLMNGSCSVSLTPSSAGRASITSVYAGDASHNTSSRTAILTFSLRPTSTTLSCPTNGSAGVALSCSVSVSDIGPGPVSTPAGSVVFTSGGSCILVAGSCSISVTPSASGALSVGASYNPNDAVHSGSSASSSITVATISPVSNNNQDNACLFSLCYPSTTWMVVAVGAIIIAGSCALFWARVQPRRSKALTK